MEVLEIGNWLSIPVRLENVVHFLLLFEFLLKTGAKFDCFATKVSFSILISFFISLTSYDHAIDSFLPPLVSISVNESIIAT